MPSFNDTRPIRRNTVLDDRGDRHPIRWGDDLAETLRAADQYDDHQAAAKAVTPGWALRISLAAIVMVAVSGVLTVLMTVGDALDWPLFEFVVVRLMLAGWSIVALLGALAVVVQVLYGRRVRAHALGVIGRCPACAYDLRGSQPETDGITLCPECGSAWPLPEQ